MNLKQARFVTYSVSNDKCVHLVYRNIIKARKDSHFIVLSGLKVCHLPDLRYPCVQRSISSMLQWS